MSVPKITVDDIREAAKRLHGEVSETPCLPSRTLSAICGCEVFLKFENLQFTASFKERGALNKMAQLTAEERAKGVLAVSAGNHAQAVAIAARLLDTHATILMPEDAPTAKVDATRGYGAEIVTYDRWAESREELGAQLAAERGLELVRPYDDLLVMAGQGTTALELLEEVPDLDLLVAPVGGGGLMAGCSTVAKELRPGIRVVGVEPETGDDTRRSLAAGKRINGGVPRTIADGLQTPMPGELTFEVNRLHVDEIVTASDAEILDAMAFLFDRLKIVTEPSGAIGIAALLAGRIAANGGRVGVVVSGGNVGFARFAELLGGG